MSMMSTKYLVNIYPEADDLESIGFQNHEILGLWGKTDPFEPLVHHMINVGCTAKILLTETPYSRVADMMSERMQLPRETIMRWLTFLCSTHDILKATLQFQHQNGRVNTELNRRLRKEGWLPANTDIAYLDHSYYLAGWLAPILRKEFGIDKLSSHVYSQALAMHHYRLPKAKAAYLDPSAPEYGDADGRMEAYWHEVRMILVRQLEDVFLGDPFHECPNVKKEDAESTAMLLTGLLILSDWIASNTELMPVSDPTINPDVYYPISISKARRAITMLGFGDVMPKQEDSAFASIFPAFGLGGYSLRPIQQACETLIQRNQLPPRLLIVEAPMGEGKTETALYVSRQWQRLSGCEGIYVALPTSATSNQMHGRVNAFLKGMGLEKAKARLVHGMAWLIDNERESDGWRAGSSGEFCTEADEEAKNAAERWFQPLRRALLAPYGVGTVDQPMQAALFSKYGALRLFGLFGKILVIDEVHAYDVFMSTILERLLAWCGCLGVPVVLLSATLPSGRKASLMKSYSWKETLSPPAASMAYPSLTWLDAEHQVCELEVPGTAIHRRISLSMHPGMLADWRDMMARAHEDLANGGCLAIILNTVTEAQVCYQAVLDAQGDGLCSDAQVMLFHA